MELGYRSWGGMDDSSQHAAILLQDCKGALVDVPSTWKADIALRDAQAQTLPVPTTSTDAQTTEHMDQEVQTERLWSVSKAGDVPDAVLIPIVTRMAAVIELAMMENERRLPLTLLDNEGDDEEIGPLTVECVHELHPFGVRDNGGGAGTTTGEDPPQHSNLADWSSRDATAATLATNMGIVPGGRKAGLELLECTSVSWNATGYVLAAAYGRFDVTGWCTHAGALCTWNLGRRARDSENARAKPDVTIEIDNCLMCIAFHPTHPALIVGGTYNGEVFLWDLSRDDPQRAVSRISEASHREPVTQLSWHYNLREGSLHTSPDLAYQVVSIGMDGRVLVWSMAKLDDPLYGYELLHPRPDSSKILTWGGTCMSFSSASRDDHGTFVVGTEGGAIFKCFLHHNDQLADEFARQLADPEIWRNAGGMRMRSPVKGEYRAHAGPVYGISSSPFHRNIFLSCGADGSIHLRSLLQGESLLSLEPTSKYLFGVEWSPSRPLLLAAAGGDGRVYIYDLHQSALNPATTLDVRGTDAPVHALAFNQHLHSFLAASDGATIKVYELGRGLVEERPREQRMLEKMAEAGLKDSVASDIHNPLVRRESGIE